MPIVTSTEMFKKAYDGGYAIGASPRLPGSAMPL